jgi:hypothetical protein
MPQTLVDVGGLATMFVPPVWNPDKNFMHSEWIHWRWAGACVDYHNSCCNNWHGRNWQLKGFRGCLDSALEHIQEKTSDYDIANIIWESVN